MTLPAAAWPLLATAPGQDELRPGLDPLDVSPGLLGFLVVFAMVLACIPLFRSLTGKLRGVEHRAQDEAQDAELRAAQAEVTEVLDAATRPRVEDADGPADGPDGGGIPPAR